VDGYSGIAITKGPNGNTRQVISDGHKIRDNALRQNALRRGGYA